MCLSWYISKWAGKWSRILSQRPCGKVHKPTLMFQLSITSHIWRNLFRKSRKSLRFTQPVCSYFRRPIPDFQTLPQEPDPSMSFSECHFKTFSWFHSLVILRPPLCLQICRAAVMTLPGAPWRMNFYLDLLKAGLQGRPSSKFPGGQVHNTMIIAKTLAL